MHSVHRTPAVTAFSTPTRDIDVDLLIVPVFEGDDLGDEPDLDAASCGELGHARARGDFRGMLYEVLLTTGPAPGWKTRRLAFVGAGIPSEFTADRLRRIAVVGGLTARQRRLARVCVLGRSALGLPAERIAQMVAEGATLANFEGASYRTGPSQPTAWLADVTVRVEGDASAASRGADRGVVLGECTNVARELANEPSNALTPTAMAERAVAVAKAAGLGVDVLDQARMAALNMGLLLGVAQGSKEPPRLLVLRHDPPQAPPGVTLGLVGKGITFDTGGISIKPADNMDKMKDDMSGGAAVIGAMAAIARLGVPVRCIGVVPMTENMPGGAAFKPGDVLTSAEGKTVEILNTDAEGRLVLGDALWYARELGATHLVDLATLTGACVVALGKSTTGLFGRPDHWVDVVRRATEHAGERSWQLPLYDDYKELFKSEIADFANAGGRAAGAITGALFIREFAGDLPWVHMDIAGTAWAEDSTPYQAKGATGVGVRTLVALASDAATWSGVVRATGGRGGD
jgi:leucyl aminopeptidase